MQKYFDIHESLFPHKEMINVFALFILFESFFIVSMFFITHSIIILYVALFILAFVNINSAIVLLLINDPLYFIIRIHNVDEAVLTAVFREFGIVLIILLILANQSINIKQLYKRNQSKELRMLLFFIIFILLTILQTRNFTTYLLGLREYFIPMIFLFFLIITNSEKRVTYLKVAVYIQILMILLLEGHNIIFPESYIFSGDPTPMDFKHVYRAIFGISGYRIFNSMFIGSSAFGSIIFAGVGVSSIIYSIIKFEKQLRLVSVILILIGLYLIWLSLQILSYGVFASIVLVLAFYFTSIYYEKGFGKKFLVIFFIMIIFYLFLSLLQPYLEVFFVGYNIDILNYFYGNILTIFGIQFLCAALINLVASYLAVRKYSKV